VEPSPVQYPLFAAVPFAAGVICTALSFAILSRDPGDRTIRANALFLLAPGWWAFFETLADVVAEGEEIIDESLEGIDRAAGIVRDVREFSHAGHRERDLADLNELMDQVIRVAAPEIAEDVSIDRGYGELPLIPCSPQQIKQVFLNLIINAIHAVEGSGAVTITTQVEGNEVRIRVDDDGRGIHDSVLERIFDPFFTTKEVGQGTGLGLSISHEILRGHGGEIVVEPKNGAGACFIVTLPLTGAPDSYA
jgi:two-component system NtrC family sensor kinase